MMEVDELLEDLEIDSIDLLRRCLRSLADGNTAQGAIFPEIELRYRLLGIVALLRDADRIAFRDHLHRSASAGLHFRRLFQQGADVAETNLPVTEHCAFGDAIIAGDLEIAREIARLSPTEHVDGHEYEDDFLRFHFLHRLILDADDAELEAILDRWQQVLDGAPSPAWDVSRALLDRDTGALHEALGGLIDAHTAYYDEFRNNTGYIPEVEASLGKVLMNGLVALRFAELREIPTEPEYRYMPSLARLAVAGDFPDRDAWRTL